MGVKVLGVCGSGVKGGNVELLLSEAVKAAEEMGDVEAEMITLWDKTITQCDHCNWCLKKQEEGEYCNKNDDMVEIYPKVLEADVLLLGCPVYAGKLSGQLACFIDRCFPFARGNHYRLKLHGKVGGALAVAFRRDIPINAGPGGSLGAHAVSSLGGTGEFDPEVKHHVLKDEAGLKTARSLAKRCVILAKLLKAGEKASHQSLQAEWRAIR
jgi:multimeric flavodoxin WrbA